GLRLLAPRLPAANWIVDSRRTRGRVAAAIDEAGPARLLQLVDARTEGQQLRRREQQRLRRIRGGQQPAGHRDPAAADTGRVLPGSGLAPDPRRGVRARFGRRGGTARARHRDDRRNWRAISVDLPKSTCRYFGERDYQVRTAANAKVGTLIGLSAVLARDMADSAGGALHLIPFTRRIRDVSHCCRSWRYMPFSCGNRRW